MRLQFRLAIAVATACFASLIPRPILQAESRGPATPPAIPPRAADPATGRDVFRFETFGTEGFWTDAVRLPQGLVARKVTPLGLLDLGLSLDSDAIRAGVGESLLAEFKTDRTPGVAPNLNDPSMTGRLIEANAVIGLVPKGGKLGLTCVVCHAITDGSVWGDPGKGSVGRRVDGRTPHQLDLGRLFATAANSRALYPLLQLQDGEKTIGRASKGLTAASTEEDVDAYFANPANYPVGTLDATPDGHGNGTVIMPVFRQDLAAPFGSPGESATFLDTSNRTYTTVLDLTTLLTPEGRKFVAEVGGRAGTKIVDDYEKVLKETGVGGYPFVRASVVGEVGQSATPLGRRVDEGKLADLAAFCEGLVSPPGVPGESAAVSRGMAVFQARCTACHGADPARPVPPTVVDIGTLWPGYSPRVTLSRKPPLDAVQDSPGGYDDHVIVLDASGGGKPRGFAIPLLLDLARKPHFLHDASVPSLDALLDPARGADAPHPISIADPASRSDLVTYLKSLGSQPTPGVGR